MSILQRETTVRYDCPHCRAALESVPGRWRGWLLCPDCGRPGLPPPPGLVLPPEELPESGAGLRAEQWIAAGDVPDEGWPRWSPGLPLPTPRPSPLTKAAQTAVAVGLALSLFLLLIGYLDQSPGMAVVAGLGALVCFWLRVRLGSRR
ncbi:hypothetical protein [Paludisphaera mucosa]|uniref:Uncharacterized protein n=1 Tax=Paludisphaera mucosa TaxID=3030827 RepID=A0ABT6FGU7_9BACT|nr:hypothetical protein [Paludisphaera mucosa]MDG3006767.1 hypothetical protein [Paludisphaera mucosa]